MKKFTSLLIGVSLALAGVAFAQQTEESPAAGGKKGKEKTTEQAEPKTPKTQGATTGAEQGTGTGHKGKAKAESSVSATGAGTGTGAQTGAGATTETGAKGKHGRAKAETSTTGTGNESATGASGQTGAGATTETGAGAGKGKHGRAKAETSAATGASGTGASAEAGASASVAPGGKKAGHEKGMKAGAGAGVNAKASVAPSASAAPTVAASASAAPSVAATGATGGTGAVGATGQQTTGANANVATGGGATAHVEKQKVEQVKQQAQTIKQQNVNFKAQPRPDRAPAVTFSVNYRIAGSERWSGPQYEVFRTYHPERHDRGWYHSRYQRVELIAGGYYFWNNGYWYPAWGYDPGQEYYAYDAPIYVGHRAEPPDRVIADVQAELQQMGYYRGEVDGLLGPLTRQALTAYQADNGLQITAVIDEPTLNSLDMG